MKIIFRFTMASLIAFILLISATWLLRSLMPGGSSGRVLAVSAATTTMKSVPTLAMRQVTTDSVVLDKFDNGKPPLSNGTVVTNIIFAASEVNAHAQATDSFPLLEERDFAQTTDLGKTPLSQGTKVDNVVFAENGVSAAALQIAAQANGVTETAIQPWYGTEQPFGKPGEPQMQINLLGTVITPTGTITLSYKLNNGPEQPLSVGPDQRRLAQTGDFNIDIPYSELATGINTIDITAKNQVTTTSQTVLVNYYMGNQWPLTYTTNWETASTIQERAQIVDGRWVLSDGQVRPTVLDYDRMIAIGDVSWTGYEITVPVTIHAIDEAGFAAPSNGPGVGLLLRWQGHFQKDDEQPEIGWQNFGSIGWYRWRKDDNDAIYAGQQLLAFGGREVDSNAANVPAFGVQYIMKMSVQPSTNGPSYYRYKAWRADEAEPAAWDLESFGRAGEPTTGSLLLVAHHVDASFGNVNVYPISSVRSTVTTTDDGNGMVQVTPQQIDYSYGEEVKLTAKPDLGFAFYAWEGDVQSTENPLILYPTGDLTVRATFTVPKPSLLTATVDGAGAVRVLPEKAIYEYDDLVTLTAVPDPQHIFAGWRGDLVTDLNPVSFRIRRDVTMEAAFTEGSASPISDDFRTCRLDTTLWTARDPKGDSTIALNGQQLVISVPANSDHDLFDNKNFAPRILQATPNEDFVLEAKFDSIVAQRFQIQGIIVEQDTDNYIRMEFYHNGTSVHVFAAYMADGVIADNANTAITVPAGAALYMQVGRAGNTWSQYYSVDGENWIENAEFNHELTVVSAGVYGGNVDPDTRDEEDTSPAFTALVDYFFNSAARIDDEDGGDLTITTAVVGFGEVTKSPTNVANCGDAIELTATPADGFIFAGWSGDLTSNVNPLSVTPTEASQLTATFIEEITDGFSLYLPFVAR